MSEQKTACTLDNLIGLHTLQTLASPQAHTSFYKVLNMLFDSKSLAEAEVQVSKLLRDSPNFKPLLREYFRIRELEGKLMMHIGDWECKFAEFVIQRFSENHVEK